VIRNLLPAALILIFAALGSGTALAAAASLPDIEDEVMCPICGTLLAESQSPQADRERQLIRRLIAQGATKDEVKDALVRQYGRQVLAEPRTSGFDLTAWLVPGVGIVLGALVVGVLGLRGLRSPGRRASEPKLDPAEAARLREDMSRYGL
jgi:cytochrome c-type biogenesis protein CcmH